MVINVSTKEALIAPRQGGKHHRGLAVRYVVVLSCLIAAFYYLLGTVRVRDDEDAVFEILSGEEGWHVGSEGERERLAQLGLTPRAPVILRDSQTGKEKKLHGRFLHITDIHPDSHYREGSSIDKQCHRDKPEDKKDRAPRFGRACAGCDGSVDLMDYTLKWIKENVRDEIDFVIWTGDNVRHDNDRQIPRTEFEILDMNEVLAQKMHSLFCDHESNNPRDFDAMVVPSLGNNDVFPHNLFAMGPTLQTREYYRIWNTFVPQEQQRIFDRSASFVTEVIPGKLAVISINTLFLFKSNPLVDNCDSKKQPGYQLLVWLGNILQEMRERGIKVWLSGHVPAIPKNYADSCYDKFTLWTYEYRDIIIGSLYGHMNMDHFIPADGKKSWKIINEREQLNGASLYKSYSDNEADAEVADDDDDFFLDHAMCASETHLLGAKPVQKESYMNSVKNVFYQKIFDKFEDQEAYQTGKRKRKNLRKKRKSMEKLCERYSIVQIAGSVIPTFNPGFRIWEYNLTGIDNDDQLLRAQSWDKFYQNLERIMDNDVRIDEDYSIVEITGKRSKNDKTLPAKKPKNLPLGPAHVAQLFSPTKFIQYFADLSEIDKQYKDLLKQGKNASEAADFAFKYKVEYTSQDEPYALGGLLVKDYISLASKLVSDKKLWKKFLERAFISSGYKD
ncbi:hypothetical protein HG535_0D05350 [Zygotorulaspora mrakii]|uniref:Endopolyphosphatase n=1 Tax=Zygotorulaspora mrakii TaxID=42260 RepID=A0A7H9B324_ZYGMR|nr:uncharacterized protein HG535_0D05350 [Zygotorulaspora mrakii]QLG72826.1 hypothetical protein HG535_0D05350 [Zygotorulaspora mrakii]